MKELTITIPVKSFKKFDNPYDSKAMAAKYQFFVNVADIPSEWLEWLSVNPREQKLTNPILYDPMTPIHPIQSYTGKAASLNKFLKMSPLGVKEEDPEYRNAVIEKLTKIIPDIFKLWDDIEVNFAKVSKELNRRYGSKPYSNYGKDNVKKISMFSNVEMDYTVPKGIMYPVVGAFRALVCERDGQYDWTISPFNVWDEKKEQIVTSVLESSAQFGNSPDKLGKSTLLWDSLYNMILIYRITNEMKNRYYYWYKKVQTVCVEAMEMPDTLSMPEFMSLPVPAEPANVPVESAIRSYAVVTMHIGKAGIEAEWDKLLD